MFMDDWLTDGENDVEIDMGIDAGVEDDVFDQSNSNSTILLLKEGLYLTGYN